MFYKVYLKGGTTGAIESEKCEEALVGTEITVSSRDENGLPIQLRGIVEEVLEKHEYEASYPVY
jgi:hypothetical protein